MHVHHVLESFCRFEVRAHIKEDSLLNLSPLCIHVSRKVISVADISAVNFYGWVVRARIHAGFHRFTEISHIFHTKYIFLLTVNFSDKISKMVWTFSANPQGFIRGQWN